MGKPKSDTELVRFLWRRNPKFDIMLLEQVQTKNPFAFKNQKQAWIDIAKVLQEGILKMKVSDRSCRERVAELLKFHRKDERESARASGVSEEEMSDLKKLLTSVSELEEKKPEIQLNELYSKKDKAEAEAVRASALVEVSSDSESDNDDIGNKTSANELRNTVSKKRKSNDASVDLDFGRGRSMSTDSEDSVSFEAASSKAGTSKIGMSKIGKPNSTDSRRTNPKKDLIQFLEKKTKTEFEFRKEELILRKKEAENKAAELEIKRLKMEADIEQNKKINDALLKMASRE